MRLIRGTTPVININIKNNIDLTKVVAIWVYIYQDRCLKVDKKLTDVTIDNENQRISLKLSQEDTLRLKEGDALFQIRLLLMDDTALATVATSISIKEIYKGGVISE